MSTLMDELAALLRQAPSVRVQHHPSEMLVTLPVGNGRSQVVKASTHALSGSGAIVIHLQSRACIARDHRAIRQALRHNARSVVAGLALESGVKPHTLDVTYSILSDGITLDNLLDSLQRVAGLADSIEASVSGEDNF